MNEFIDFSSFGASSQSAQSGVRVLPESQMGPYSVVQNFKAEDMGEWDMLAMISENTPLNDALVLVGNRSQGDMMDMMEFEMDAPDDISEIDDDEERPDDYEVEDEDLDMDLYLDGEDFDFYGTPPQEGFDKQGMQCVDPKDILFFNSEKDSSKDVEHSIEFGLPERSPFASLLSDVEEFTYSSECGSLFDDVSQSAESSEDDSSAGLVNVFRREHKKASRIKSEQESSSLRSSSFSRPRELSSSSASSFSESQYSDEDSGIKSKVRPRSRKVVVASSQHHAYQCEWSTNGKSCGRTFTRPYDLTRHHETVHSTEKKVFHCSYCKDKTFSRLDALTRHMKTKHNA